MNGKLSLKIFSHHDQNIFFCKTLCQSLSSPRPRVASRVSAATWMAKNNNIFLNLENFEEQKPPQQNIEEENCVQTSDTTWAWRAATLSSSRHPRNSPEMKVSEQWLKSFLRMLGFARFDFEPQVVWFNKKIGSKTITQIFPNESLDFYRNLYKYDDYSPRAAASVLSTSSSAILCCSDATFYW